MAFAERPRTRLVKAVGDDVEGADMVSADEMIPGKVSMIGVM
jgi:hypothetical protein